MKTLQLAAAAGLSLAAAALAAPALAQDSSDAWDGWYVGANLGWTAASSRQSVTINPNTYFANSSVTSIQADGDRKLHDHGVVGGLQVGFNRQSGGMVWGIEGDFNALDNSNSYRKTTTYPCCGPSSYTLTQEYKTTWLATLRPRIGVTMGNWLVYGTGGVAVADFKASERFTDNFTAAPGAQQRASTSKNRTGWTLGAGAEYGMADGWSVKGEYLYADFGKEDYSGAMTNPASTTTFNDRADLRVHILRIGVNKRF